MASDLINKIRIAPMVNPFTKSTHAEPLPSLRSGWEWRWGWKVGQGVGAGLGERVGIGVGV